MALYNTAILFVLLTLFQLSFTHDWGFDNFLKLSGHHLPHNSGEEEIQHYYEVWRNNVQYIEEHNSMESTFKLEINKFTHLLPYQLPKTATWSPKGNIPSLPVTVPAHVHSITADPPSQVDWRVKGDVSAVHNQGEMGCSFEIVFADVVSSFYAIKNGRLVQFSPQQLIDCCTEDCRCNQLKEPGQLAYCIKKHGGLCPDYRNSTRCECEKCNEDKFMIKGMKEVPSKNETALEYAVAMEPVMVGIDAGERSFQLYKEGIYNDPMCSSTRLDHLLLVVGYGSDDGHDYWLCKNSWGVEWGMSGYIKIARNANNMCGVATAAYYPY